MTAYTNPPTSTSRRNGVGSSAARVDARLKTSGAARYVGDLRFAGLKHIKVVRSPVSRGVLLTVDTMQARAMPGVVRIITADDLPYGPFGHLLRDQPILADGAVRFAGEPVALVVADSEAEALRAAAQVGMEISELPAATLELPTDRPDLLDNRGREPGFLASANVTPHPVGNVCYRYEHTTGDVEALVAAADVVVEGSYTFPSAYQYAMEPHGAVGHWNDGRLELWSSCQHPFLVRQELARLFGLELDHVRIQVPLIGGGFGSKSYLTVEPLVAAAALLVEAPVRLLNTVEEAMLTTRQHNMTATMTTAATADGELIARRVRIAMDTGAYATNGPTVTFITGLVAPGPYAWPGVDVVADCVYTNRSPAGSYRGFGASHTQWIGELQLDEVARRTGVDRVELRRRNLLRRGMRMHPGLKPIDADLVACLERVQEDPATTDARVGQRLGRGFGVAVVPAGAEYTGNAIVRLRRDGRATVVVGTSEIGQGARTVFSQIVAEVLGIDPADIAVPGADTATTPYDRSTGASRSTTMVGLAVYRACGDVLAQLATLAARRWGCPGEVEHVDGRLVAATGQSASVHEAVAMLATASDELVGRGRVGVGDDPADFPVFWEACAASATVAVDEATGRVTVLQVVTSPDVGRALNPQLVEVQDIGCTVQAAGQTLFEHLEHAPDGALLSPSLAQYQVPTTELAPRHMVSRPVENADGPGPFGAKGCGEGPFGSVPAAITTALADAGASLTELPATPERVWSAIRRADAAR